MDIARKHGRYAHAVRVRCSVERRVHRLMNHHPLLAVTAALVTMALCFVVVLVRVVAAMALKIVMVAGRVAINIMLVVCRNIFRMFPA